MHRFQYFRSFAVLATLLLSSIAWAQQSGTTTVKVGGTALVVPIPAGFTDPRESVPGLDSILLTMVPPTNRLLGYYVDNADAKALASGKEFAMKRYFMLQVMHRMEDRSMSDTEFKALKAELKSQQDALVEHVKSQAKPLFDRAAAHIGDKIDDKSFAVRMNDLANLGVFGETDYALGWAASSKMTFVVESKPMVLPIVQSSVILHVKGKALFLYAFSDHSSPGDLKWVKDVSMRWSAAIHQAN